MSKHKSQKRSLKKSRKRTNTRKLMTGMQENFQKDIQNILLTVNKAIEEMTKFDLIIKSRCEQMGLTDTYTTVSATYLPFKEEFEKIRPTIVGLLEVAKRQLPSAADIVELTKLMTYVQNGSQIVYTKLSDASKTVEPFIVRNNIPKEKATEEGSDEVIEETTEV